jgi:cytochrome c biogenesis factor
MRAFYLTMVALLVVALGVLEMVSARAASLADPYPDTPASVAFRGG